MAIPSKKLLRLLVEHDPGSPEFKNGVQATLHQETQPQDTLPQETVMAGEFDMWRDVFVHRPLPWSRFLQSALLHGTALALIWGLSLAWLRQQKILGPTPFDRSALITYSPEEYLPPLDTGQTEATKQTGDPAYAKQPILSVPREADNRSQTIVAPPDIKLNHDVPLPNIIATGTITPAVPLDATNSLSRRVTTPDQQVIAPAPEVDFARERIHQAGLKSDVIPPPPDVKADRARGLTGPEAAVIEPPPDLTSRAKGHVGLINIGPSEVVAPAPQLAMAEQHSLSSRGNGPRLSGSVDPVAPPPSVGASGGSGSQGRLVALGIHPVAPSGPVAVPGGNRRGTFSATPQGKPGASGTPDLSGSSSTNAGSGSRGHNSSLPAGLRVGAVPGAIASIERNGHASSGNGDGDGREVASLDSSNGASATGSNRRAASTLSEDKITDVDRQVFGDRRPSALTLNMPNLNSSTGSWVMHFAELQPEPKEGPLVAPFPTEKSDPGYPLELMRANVHGQVTLYAVIHPDGRVGNIRVLKSADERLDSYATDALSRWKFLPAIRDGKPVPIEAVVVIPFRVRQSF